MERRKEKGRREGRERKGNERGKEGREGGAPHAALHCILLHGILLHGRHPLQRQNVVLKHVYYVIGLEGTLLGSAHEDKAKMLQKVTTHILFGFSFLSRSVLFHVSCRNF